MAKHSQGPGLAVPSRRLARLWHLGRATGDLAIGVGLKGLMELARGGESGRIELSPEATRRFTERLARMRGAAMKMGQLMSMDGTDIFTAEAAGIMATLRDSAEPMPMGQLNRVLSEELGGDWDKRFSRFEFRPMAAASIGQVHRAETRDGRGVALKVQFPGVRESIDSDIDNLIFLVRNLGLVPKGLDPEPMLEEARRQLHAEADYRGEADALERYAGLLGDNPDLRVPRIHRDLSGPRVLAMELAEGVSVEHLAEPDFRRAERDRVAGLLLGLTLREVFELRLMQTDPNFGNFLYDREGDRIWLLDFGATRTVPDWLADHYGVMARAAIEGDRDALLGSAIAMGYVSADADPGKVDAMLGLLDLSAEPLRRPGVYDFGSSDLFERVFHRGKALFLDDGFDRLPHPSTLFIHRKLAGSFMLCRRLRARVDLREMMASYL